MIQKYTFLTYRNGCFDFRSCVLCCALNVSYRSAGCLAFIFLNQVFCIPQACPVPSCHKANIVPKLLFNSITNRDHTQHKMEPTSS
jgi:hypothetical protein